MNDQIWRDEKTLLPIHIHHRLMKDGFLWAENSKPCACGNPVFDISISAGELVKKHEAKINCGLSNDEMLDRFGYNPEST